MHLGQAVAPRQQFGPPAPGEGLVVYHQINRGPIPTRDMQPGVGTLMPMPPFAVATSTGNRLEDCGALPGSFILSTATSDA